MSRGDSVRALCDARASGRCADERRVAMDDAGATTRGLVGSTTVDGAWKARERTGARAVSDGTSEGLWRRGRGTRGGVIAIAGAKRRRWGRSTTAARNRIAFAPDDVSLGANARRRSRVRPTAEDEWMKMTSDAVDCRRRTSA